MHMFYFEILLKYYAKTKYHGVVCLQAACLDVPTGMFIKLKIYKSGSWTDTIQGLGTLTILFSEYGKIP